MKVPYPETGFMMMVFFGVEKSEYIAPLDIMYKTAKLGILALEQYQKMLEKESDGKKVIGVTIIQMKFRKEIELKREYWTNPVNEDPWRCKFASNLKFLDNPRLYQYMVLPRYFDEKLKEWKLAVANPFFITDDNDTIEKYILASDENVDERAKNAATYTVEKMWGMNWKTKEMKEVDLGKIGEIEPEMVN